MLEYLRKRLGEAKAQETEKEQAAVPAGAGNQAMLSMLEAQGERGEVQPASGGTPLAEAMRAKFERHFGLPMDDVRVHRNSDEPAKFDAGAYTYGTDIFIGPGQEDLLNHEMTHVAQQKLGQVRPTGMEHGMAINRSPALEHSADIGTVTHTMGPAAGAVVQCCGKSSTEEKQDGDEVKAELDVGDDSFLDLLGIESPDEDPDSGESEETKMRESEYTGITDERDAIIAWFPTSDAIRAHILQGYQLPKRITREAHYKPAPNGVSYHRWHHLVDKDPRSDNEAWRTVVELIARVMKEGTEAVYKKAGRKKTLQIEQEDDRGTVKKRTIVVTYGTSPKFGDIPVVSDAWVEKRK